MEKNISVILTCWQRPQLLEKQIELILNQTIPAQEIVLWYNAPPKKLGFLQKKQLLTFKNERYVKKIICDHNFGIIPRFTLASCLKGEYICIFDDDTMPGSRWFENCLHYVDDQQVLCGTIGLRYLSKTKLQTETPRMGWEGMNPKLERVDLVGHSWFFRREWARYFWETEPILRTFGEDIHFCSMLQRHNIGAACPPHPVEDRSLWGSTNPKLGVDKVAISCSSDKSADFWKVVKYEIDNGYRPILL